MTAPDSSDATRQQQHDHLQSLREDVQDQIPYVEDLELKQALREWLSDSYDLPSGSIDGHIQQRLGQMETEYRMHNHDGVSTGADAFPTECQGCPSYGGGCPIVTHPTPQKELERLGEEAEDDEVYTLKVRRLARDYDCHRIPEFIDEFEDKYARKIRRGHELLSQTDVEIFDSATDGPTERVDVQFEEGES